jgi:hypothetical protein
MLLVLGYQLGINIERHFKIAISIIKACPLALRIAKRKTEKNGRF